MPTERNKRAEPSAPAPEVPPPPEDPEGLLAWADAHQVSDRLDDVLIGGGDEALPAGTFFPGRAGEALTYRQILVESGPAGDARRRRPHDAEETARTVLHRLATLVGSARASRAWAAAHGRDPDDEVLEDFLARLRAALRELVADRQTAARPPGTYQPLPVRVVDAPPPTLRYREEPLVGTRRGTAHEADEVALSLLGWNDGPLRWAWVRGAQTLPTAVSVDERRAALEAMVELVRDPRADAEAARESLTELLRLPAWQYALGTLDESLSRLEADAAGASTGAGEERIAFRVTAPDGGGAWNVEPLLQKRGRSAAAPFSKGARLPWFQLAEQRGLSAADRRAFQAYDDRFARRANSWGAGALTAGQLFGILRALIDHPAVFLDGARAGDRLDIRQGRLRLRFAATPDGALTPQFELLGATLLAPEVAEALRDERHLVHLHRPEPDARGGPQVLLAQVSPQAAALVRALAVAPARFPPEAHDALATRLETLQETVDIEFPSQWTRTIGPADGRLIARLELLLSGALQLRLVVRPVKLGPAFAPGEGPALVLEGQGRDRHGARRERHDERQAGRALAERLGLGGAEEQEPWCWRVPEGDAALHVVATLRELSGEVSVEWADDAGWLALGSVGRQDMRMKVADRRDWFSIEGGAVVAGGQTVPLADLLAAIREERRYVRVGARGFVRIEEQLREALARAEGAIFESRGVLQVAAVGSDPLLGLVEVEAQLEASAAFRVLRRRMQESALVADSDGNGSSDSDGNSAADGGGGPGAGARPRLSPALEARLRPYQKAGVAWMARLAHWGAGAILADEMGLGKTVQTLAVLAHRAGSGPALVVAPTSVVANWVDEAARFVPELTLRLYRGAERAALLRGLGPGDLLVTSYAIATLDAAALQAIAFGTLVLDEAQAVKNASTERAQALRGIQAAWRVGLTGTPIENHIGELWSLLRVLSPGLLGSWEQFRARYAIPIEKFGDDRRRQGLATLVRPFILRRTKAEVARELPARTEIVRLVRLSAEERGLYEELRRATLEELAQAKADRERDAAGMRFVLLAALTRLRQLCCHPRLVYPRTAAGSSKAAVLLELLSTLREDGRKALVFSQFRSFLDLLAPRLRHHGFRVLVLDGTTPVEARAERVAAFQRGEADVFLISLKAGGFGLNLTAADTVIHLDPWWNPAVEDQATARAHRIGQRRPVTAVRLVAQGTIEQAVLGLHAAKRALATSILEGADVAASLDSDELLDLIRRGAPE